MTKVVRAVRVDVDGTVEVIEHARLSDVIEGELGTPLYTIEYPAADDISIAVSPQNKETLAFNRTASVIRGRLGGKYQDTYGVALFYGENVSDASDSMIAAAREIAATQKWAKEALNDTRTKD
jgi:hypothetical protein